MIDIIFKPSSSPDNSYLKWMVNALENNGVHVVNKDVEEKSIRLFFKLILFVFNKNKKIVHCNWPENTARTKTLKNRLKVKMLLLKADILHFLHIKVCWTMHNLIPHNCEDILFAERFMKRWASKMDMILVHCKDSERMLINKYGVNRNKILYVPHGAYSVDIINEDLKSKFIKKYEIQEKNIVFLCFGVISEYKNIPLLLEVFDELENLDIRLLLIGKIDSNMEIDKKNKIRLKCGQMQNVFLDERFVPDDEISTIFSLCDMVVLPYDKKSMQNSGAMILAFSNGKPVIISEFGYVSDIKDKDFVFSFDYNDYEEAKSILKEQITKAVSQREQLKNLGCMAKEFSDKELDWNLIGKKIVKAYNEL